MDQLIKVFQIVQHTLTSSKATQTDTSRAVLKPKQVKIIAILTKKVFEPVLEIIYIYVGVGVSE